MKFPNSGPLIAFCLLTGIICGVTGGNSEDELSSSDSDEARSVVSPELFNWEAAKKGISSFIVPIIPSAGNASSIGNAVENFFKTSASQVSSAIEGAIPEDVRTNVQLATAIVQSSSKNFGDLIFPEGQNTSLTEGFSNAVNEIQATAKELHSMGIHEKIGQSLLAKLMPEDEESESVEQVHTSPHDVASQRAEEEMYSTYGNNSGIKTSSTTWTIVTIVVVSAIIVNVILFYAVYKRKKSTRKTTQENDLQLEDSEQREKLNATSLP